VNRLLKEVLLVAGVAVLLPAPVAVAASTKLPLSPLARPTVEPEPEDVAPIPRIKVVPRAGMCIGPAIPVGPRTGYFACPDDNLNPIEPAAPTDSTPSSLGAGLSV
jgi:hypothetical protein